MKVPNKLNMQHYGCIFISRDTYTLFLPILSCNEFDKMQVPYTREFYTQSVYSLFGDDWNLRFCALISVGALFILLYIFRRKHK